MGGGKQEESPSGKRRESRLLMIVRTGRWLTMTEQNHGSSLNSAKRGGTVAVAEKGKQYRHQINHSSQSTTCTTLFTILETRRLSN